MGKPKAVFVVSTFPIEESAAEVGKKLVKEGLCACISFTKVRSIYSWKGKLENQLECIAFFKAAGGSAQALKEALARLHPYEVPEIMEIEVSDVSMPYLSWLVKNEKRRNKSAHRVAEKRNHPAKRRNAKANVS
ncbi:MAG TPA: divalent-cation tolerance protein CutA [Nitrososphaera sp.]|nr:divalent-cation tolerance protein CutA [Nitrososphaera sp.]